MALAFLRAAFTPATDPYLVVGAVSACLITAYEIGKGGQNEFIHPIVLPLFFFTACFGAVGGPYSGIGYGVYRYGQSRALMEERVNESIRRDEALKKLRCPTAEATR
jgi:hypothetical protein